MVLNTLTIGPEHLENGPEHLENGPEHLENGPEHVNMAIASHLSQNGSSMHLCIAVALLLVLN